MKTSPLTVAAKRILDDQLRSLYGPDRASECLMRLEQILQAHVQTAPAPPATAGPLSERDAVLITYADMLEAPGAVPLQTLAGFIARHLDGLLSGVHLLPFFPSSSDDGFSVVDYRTVSPELGSWDDVERIAKDARLMLDAVINHASVQSAWFRAFLAGQPPYKDYFITVDPDTDLSDVVRPRDLNLLTRFETASGTRHVWTTFSEDQADLNFANPEVLLEMIDLLFEYVRRGAQIIRLDAVAFLWKEIGTPSIHLKQTHQVVQLFRTLIDELAPWVYLITETNVPHKENISYFGDGTNEAHMVYQFPLPPLVLHTFTSGDATRLTAWASELSLPSGQTYFFNFLASHDGIGIRPVREILTDSELEALVERTLAHGGQVSYRSVKGGGRLPYELNITYFDALSEPGEVEGAPQRAVARFLASQAIMLSLAGVPGIYFHSLFGSRNDYAGVQRTGARRSINRERLALAALQAELKREGSLRSTVFQGYRRLLSARRSHPAFHPAGEQRVLALDPHVFAVMRLSSRDGRSVLCLHEVSGRPWRGSLAAAAPSAGSSRDLLTGERVDLSACSLDPYQVRWLSLEQERSGSG